MTPTWPEPSPRSGSPPGRDPHENFRRGARQLLRILEPELRAHADQWHVLNPLFGEPWPTSSQ